MDDEDLIPLSALQHYLYCPRQCALIHLEQQWAENRQTAEGRLLHQRADIPHAERRGGVRTMTAMPLLSLELGVTGQADVVEFHRGDAGERAFPVEYKRGRPQGTPCGRSAIVRAGALPGSDARHAGQRPAPCSTDRPDSTKMWPSTPGTARPDPAHHRRNPRHDPRKENTFRTLRSKTLRRLLAAGLVPTAPVRAQQRRPLAATAAR